MTDEEKAREIYPICATENIEHQAYINAARIKLQQAFLQGCYWKQQQMIEKAVEWMKDHIRGYLECNGYSECPGFKIYVTDDFYDDFKKAMKGE